MSQPGDSKEAQDCLIRVTNDHPCHELEHRSHGNSFFGGCYRESRLLPVMVGIRNGPHRPRF